MSTAITWRTRLLQLLFPWRYKYCPAGNLHSSSDQVCYCRCSEVSSDWHGGIYDFSTGHELVAYPDIMTARSSGRGPQYGMWK